ncbi:MAG: helix-turn-helix domain-containing protein [Nocardioidaceae bacterium]
MMAPGAEVTGRGELVGDELVGDAHEHQVGASSRSARVGVVRRLSTSYRGWVDQVDPSYRVAAQGFDREAFAERPGSRGGTDDRDRARREQAVDRRGCAHVVILIDCSVRVVCTVSGRPRESKGSSERRSAWTISTPPAEAQTLPAQMLIAAAELIAERGLARTRIADVAERVGASPALVVYY